MGAPSSAAPAIPIKIEIARPSNLRTALQTHRSKELVFAVVGYAGSGTSFVASQISKLLKKELGPTGFQVHSLKARTLLDEYAAVKGIARPAGASRLELTAHYQSVGDDMRRSSNEHGGVGCRPDVRNGRLARKYDLDQDAPELAVFIDRDAEDSEQAHGQQVNRTFHLADYFVDNTHDSTNSREYGLPDQIKRLFDILFTTNIRRPIRDERGMYAAHSAALRSACLSRQVGAAILDDKGMLLAVGTNEVPRHGGGAYDGSEPIESHVHFVPYQGVSPNLYRRVYLKSGDLKDEDGKMLPVQRSERGLSSLWKKSYTDLEKDVVQFVTRFEESHHART